MATPALATEAALAGNYPQYRFNQRERKLLASVLAYLSGSAGAASHNVIAAGNLTTVGGAASEVFTVSGLLSTDVVMLTLKTNAANREIRAHIPASNSLTIRFEADPGAGVIVSYQVLRAK